MASRPNNGLVNYAGGFVFWALIAGVVSAMVPASWINLERHDARVAARVDTCVFFFIPTTTQRVDNVLRTSTKVIPPEGATASSGRSFRSRNSRTRSTESTGSLEISGSGNRTIDVAVSPASVDAVQQRIQEFLEDRQTTTARLFVVANWKFGIVGAGGLCLVAISHLAACFREAIRSMGSFKREVSAESPSVASDPTDDGQSPHVAP